MPPVLGHCANKSLLFALYSSSSLVSTGYATKVIIFNIISAWVTYTKQRASKELTKNLKIEILS